MKFYIYYNDETQTQFATVYQWQPDGETRRMYCGYLGEGRYAHQDIQFDTQANILMDKRNGAKYALISPRNTLKENLQHETVSMQIVEWEDAF